MFSSSLACGNWLTLKDDIEALNKGAADLLHIDIMDGHLVPNLCLSLDIIRGARTISDIPMDVHLMVTNPEEYIDRLSDIGVSYICTHFYATDDIVEFLKAVRAKGIKAGVAINPSEGIEKLIEIIDYLDYVLFMFVTPGFSGQKFDPKVLLKMREFKKITDERGLQIELSADGGINWENCKDVVAAGADFQVAGVFNIYDGCDIADNCDKLHRLIREAKG